jgi:hypothetical protein
MISANSARCLLPSYLDLIRDVSAGKCSARWIEEYGKILSLKGEEIA